MNNTKINQTREQGVWVTLYTEEILICKGLSEMSGVGAKPIGIKPNPIVSADRLGISP